VIITIESQGESEFLSSIMLGDILKMVAEFSETKVEVRIRPNLLAPNPVLTAGEARRADHDDDFCALCTSPYLSQDEREQVEFLDG
jgi:hypothetical protein